MLWRLPVGLIQEIHPARSVTGRYQTPLRRRFLDIFLTFLLVEILVRSSA